MNKSNDAKPANCEAAIMELAFRTCTVLLNRDLMTGPEVSVFMNGVANALDTGRLSAGITAAIANAGEEQAHREEVERSKWDGIEPSR